MNKLTLVAVFLASTTTVHAEQSFGGTAVGTGQQAPVQHVIADGHVVLHIQSTYEGFVTSDAASPMNGTSGTCFGSLQINVGVPDGGGKCVFSDAAGDLIVTTWTAAGFGADGALVGTYAYSGGSGKFSGATGGGEFSSLTDQATNMFRNDISGTLTLP